MFQFLYIPHICVTYVYDRYMQLNSLYAAYTHHITYMPYATYMLYRIYAPYRPYGESHIFAVQHICRVNNSHIHFAYMLPIFQLHVTYKKCFVSIFVCSAYISHVWAYMFRIYVAHICIHLYVTYIPLPYGYTGIYIYTK